MWKNSDPSNSNQRGPRRGLILGLLLALALGGIGQAPPARAAPASAAQSATLSVSPRSLTICKGQTRKVKVTARLLTSRSRGGRPSRQPPHTMSQLTAEPGSPVAFITPASAQLTFRTQGRADFAVTGSNVGDTILTFRMNPPGTEDELVPLVGPARASASAVQTVQVKVRECTYTLVLVSSWSIPIAWHYRMTSALVADLVPDQNGNFFTSPVVENSHRQRVRYTNPLCSKTPTIERTRANVNGRLTQSFFGGDRLDFKVTYDPVKAADTTIACTFPYVGSFAETGKGAGVAQVYDPRPVPIIAWLGAPGNGVGGTYPHELHTNLGNVQGRGIFVILTNVVPFP